MPKPKFLAVLRLITNSNCVGCRTGISAGFDPFLASGSDQRMLLERQPDRVSRDPRREGVKRKAGLRNAACNLAAARAAVEKESRLRSEANAAARMA